MTTHKIITGNSNNLKGISDKSVNLIVTSPPYPMIKMWDNCFSKQNSLIKDALSENDENKTFNFMHDILDSVWKECDRVLTDNGFVCINVGDATRTINGDFRLYSNHSRIIDFFMKHGYSVLPDIHWRKQSNSPSKFMGSGMYPAGAYVTYEHEYILVFRKGGKRIFKGKEKELRLKSAYFWEERNIWFSDLWEIKGTAQKLKASTRDRSAAFPFEIPYRLVNMYSAEGDTVLDPFVGTGTTCLACMISNRNSIGIDIDSEMTKIALDNIYCEPESLNHIIDNRIQTHLNFINDLPNEKREKCYNNQNHGFKVKTRQETAIKIDRISTITINETDQTITCTYCK